MCTTGVRDALDCELNHRGAAPRAELRLTQLPRDSISKFVSDFCQWADAVHMPRSARRKLSPALRRAIDHELPSRDANQLVLFRPICEDTRLRFCHQSGETAVLTTRVANSADSTLTLLAGISAPPWRRGWRRISCNEFVSDILDDYFHSVTTYIARSRFLNVTAAIGLAYATDCTFQYGSHSREVLIGPAPYLPSTFAECIELVSRDLDVVALPRFPESSRQRYCRTLINCLNALDPQIHRILYLYLRALRLRNGDFWEDAIVSLDSAVDVAANLVRERARTGNAHAGESMVSALQLSDRVDAMLGELRTWRNYFGAHPGEAGFWDFGDDYSEAVDEMFAAVRLVVLSASRFEAQHRLVESEPHDGWAAWFRDHAATLGPMVWFRVNPPASQPLSSTPSLASRRNRVTGRNSIKELQSAGK